MGITEQVNQNRLKRLGHVEKINDERFVRNARIYRAKMDESMRRGRTKPK